MITPFVVEVVKWKFDHYTPKNNKLLGIWPGAVSLSLWKEYRTKWGFPQIIVSNTSQKQTANSAGYFDLNIMCILPHDPPYNQDYQSRIQNVDVKYYCLDEPLEREEYTENQIIQVADYIGNNRPNSMLYITSFAHNPYLGPAYAYINILNSTSNTYIMCDKYDLIPGIPWDQRNLWQGFRDYVGYRNPSNWIHTVRDGADEFNQLIGKANNLGLNSLWLFIGSDGNSNNVDDFCDDAWQQGWLYKIERKYIYVYHCYAKEYGDCESSGNWVLYDIVETNDYRTI